MYLLGFYPHSNISLPHRAKYTISKADWRRLAKYARRVRRLVLGDCDVRLLAEFDSDVFRQLYERRENILPSLEGLTLNFETGKNLQESDLLSTFIVNGLKSLTIDFRDYDFRDYESYLVYLPSLIDELRTCSDLTEFTLRCDEDYSPENCDNYLYELFIVQTKLKTVKIPLYGLTPLLMKALGSLPTLTSLTSEGAGYKSRLENLVPRLKFDFKLGTFKSLVALEIAGSFTDGPSVAARQSALCFQTNAHYDPHDHARKNGFALFDTREDRSPLLYAGDLRIDDSASTDPGHPVRNRVTQCLCQSVPRIFAYTKPDDAQQAS